MVGEKVMPKCSQPRTWSRKQNLKGCQMNQALHDVVVIDVDSDNVILIDDPESIPPNLVSSSVSRKGKKIEFRGVISIDDDDETDDVDSTSSAPDDVPKPANFDDDDECRVVLEENSAFRSSKRQQAHSGSNRYGLYGVYESCSSDDDSSDCEVMEGSYGKLHEEWKKAFSKKFNARKEGKHRSEDQSSSFFMNINTQTGAADKFGRRNEKFSETAFPSNSSGGNNKNQNFSAFGQAEDGHWATASKNAGKGNSYWDFPLNNDFSWPPDLTESVETSLKGDFDFSRGKNADDPSSSSFWSQRNKYAHDGGAAVHMEENGSQEPPLCSTREPSAKHNDNVKPCCTDQDEYVIKGHSTCQEFNRHFPNGKTNFDEGDVSLGKCQKSCQVPLNNESFVPNGKDEGFFQEIPACNTSPIKLHCQTGKLEKEKVFSREVNSQPSKETEVECGASPSEFEVAQGGKDLFHAQGDIITHSVQGDIITEREKLKETDDYKRAMEEEWASRNQQLKIQAEEVQRLRKKKKAENMRLLDMERRQKQRLEEIRETQKKDEENMNLKEQLRVQVRKELYNLEATCVDMASLLRGLGIHVGNSFNPLSHEVHAAYKRALLRFHPDRASKTDLRQQVEAEEKFKLISRMKEKLWSTSCH